MRLAGSLAAPFNALVVNGAVALLLLVADVCVSAEAPKSAIHRDAVQHRLTQLQNVSAHYRCTFTYLPPRELVTPGTGGLFTGDWSYECFFSFLDGSAIFDKQTLPETFEHAKKGGWLQTRREIRAFSHDRAESFTVQPSSEDGFGSIINKEVLPSDTVFDCALGLRLWERDSWLEPTDIALAALEEDEEVALTFVDNERQRHRLTFDPRLSYALKTVSVSDDGGREFYKITASDFLNVDGIFLPQTILAQRLGFDPGQPQPAERQRVQISVHDYSVNDPGNLPERYHLVWPKGTLVKDQRLGVRVRMASTPPISERNPVEIAIKMPHPATGPPAVGVEVPVQTSGSGLAWIFGVTSVVCAIAIGFSYWRRHKLRRFASHSLFPSESQNLHRLL
jgi:hypothetical protein